MNILGSCSNARRWSTVLLLGALAGCGGDGGKDPVLGTGDNVVSPPTVIVVTPLGGATNVPVNTTISATLREPVTPFAGSSTFTVTCSAPCVNPSGTVSLDSTATIATFTPVSGTALSPLTVYTATVAGTRSVATGLVLAEPFQWSFTTAATPDTTRPGVALTIPATSVPGPTAVPTNKAIVATFNEPIAPATIGTGSFTLTCAAPCTTPAGTVSYSATSNAATFTPTTALAPSTTYTATITTAVTDLAGNALGGNQGVSPAASNYVWTYTTGATTDSTRPAVTVTAPATQDPGPTPGVATNVIVTATFSEDMAPASISASTFSVTCVAPCTTPSGNVSYVPNSRTAAFTPAAPLAANTTYTATISTGAEDLAGNALAGNQAPASVASSYVWTFTTGVLTDIAAPTVSSTNPANGAVGICVNQSISATFSEPIDPLTLTPATFILAASGAPVTGVVTYDPQTAIATFNPVANLVGTPATTYTATLRSGPNGVKDLAGNSLAADSVTTFTTSALTCASAPALGAAARFGAFGGNATLTNDGLNTVINGEVGVNASSTTITGLRDAAGNVYTITPNNNGLVNGVIYTQTAPPGSVAGAAVTQARADALLAFNSISPAALPGGIDVSSLAQCPSCGGAGGGPDELAGRVLPPGVYLSSTGSFDIGGAGRTTANLTLDAGGNVDAVWVFQTAAGIGTLNVGLTGPATPAVPIQVLLINGAQPGNVFWFVPAGATIGTGATMVGTLLADASITISTTGGTPPTAVNTRLNGRAIALTAGVTMTNTIVTVPAP